MSIQHRDNCMHLECDECDRKEEIYFGTWAEAWADAKADGWRAWRDKTNTWCHSCPECVRAKATA